MKLPTKKQCVAIQKHYSMPKNMLSHTKGVTKVAVLIAQAMNRQGKKIDVDLIERAALLHDIMKIARLSDESFEALHLKGNSKKRWIALRKKYENIRHAEAAYLELKKKYPKLALIVRKHNYSAMKNPKSLTIEQKILNYADKRFEDYSTVSMKMRFKGFSKRYTQKKTKDIQKTNQNYFVLEKQIFKNLDITPKDINF
jgi:putative nucleotidyltransferase with HDIG domain